MSTTPAPGTSTTPTMNATAEWLAKEVTHNGLHEYLCRALARSSSFAREGVVDVEDHVNDAFAAWIKRDAFAKYLAEGKTPTRGNLVAWAKQVGANTMRDRGTDALHRELRGARTERERASHNGSEGGMAPWAACTPGNFKALNGDNPEVDRDEWVGIDFVDVDALDAEEMLARTEILVTVEEAFRRSCTRSQASAERFSRTFRCMAEGGTGDRLAGELGVSPLRAEKLAQEVRDRLRETEARVRDALTVMQAVEATPDLTPAEVEARVGELAHLPSTVKELVARGYVTLRKGDALALTPNGRARLGKKQDGWDGRLLL